MFHTAGLDDSSGAWYLFWSGICGDLVLLSAFGVLWRHLNCHAQGCKRLGFHHINGTQFKVCRHHHPKGGNTVEHIHNAYYEARA